MIRRAPRGLVYDEIKDGLEIKDGIIVAGDIAANAVETAKIKDAAVTKAKMANQYFAAAGTIVGLTAAIGDPAGLVEGAVYVIKDTADANKIKIVVVQNGGFFIGAALSAAA